MKADRQMRVARWLAIAALSVGLMSASGRETEPAGGGVSLRLARLPRLTVWAWERREDLRTVDARTTAVAYLARTVVVDGGGVHVVPRRQAMLLPAAVGLVKIAVVRIEVESGTALDEDSARAAGEAVSDAAADDVAALQVDFDARVSQRGWYADVLRAVRARMPAEMPLSMTALASWCSYDGGWMHGLPVDEAVPMLFRMEPDRRRAGVTGWGAGEFAVREPMCAGSVGISTREDWPRDLRGRRVYVFADRGWSRDGLDETLRSLE
jgi:hypothetical protein